MIPHQRWLIPACVVNVLIAFAHGISLDISSDGKSDLHGYHNQDEADHSHNNPWLHQASIKTAAKTIVTDLMTYYNGDQVGGIPGMLPYPPYYWWESGGMWGALINYWYYTGDTTYQNLTISGLQYQVGPHDNFEPTAEAAQLGNDDQCFWGMSAMQAAEYNFPNPSAEQPQWLALAQAVFNRQAERWETETCGGGLRWQIFRLSSQWNYKNSVSNGCFFNLAARLAKYTGNATYSAWAARAFEWEMAIGLIDPVHNWNVYDGTAPSENCTSINHFQWSYVVGLHLYGAAAMWNVTQSQTWYDRTSGLLSATNLFFRNDTTNTSPYIMWEVECEDQRLCNVDQLSFKAWLSRFMAATTLIAPWTYSSVMERLQPSAQAAVETCTGGTSGTSCGFSWYKRTFDGSSGAGQQMCVLELVQGLLVGQSKAPVTQQTGGTSEGDPSAGAGDPQDIAVSVLDISRGDRAGAWFLTAVAACVILGGGVWSTFF